MNKELTKYISVFALFYMSMAIFSCFFPVYLSSIGYNNSKIGFLLAISPLASIVVQPIWGYLSDKSKYKNTILNVLFISTTVLILSFYLSTEYMILAVLISVFVIFQAPLSPLLDTMALETSEEKKWNYGKIRMAGTIGYAVMAVLSGLILGKHVENLFLLYFVISIAGVIIAFTLPKVKGYQKKGDKVNMLVLFQDKKLVLYMLYSFLIQISLNYYANFYGIFMKNLGATSLLIGATSFISAMSEVPYLLNSKKIYKKFHIENVLLFAGAMSIVRWCLMGFITNIYILSIMQVLHGVIFIVIIVSMAMYINDTVPSNLKASAQALHALLSLGLAKVIGSMIGGHLSDSYGIANTFLINGGFAFIIVAVFGVIFAVQKRKSY